MGVDIKTIQELRLKTGAGIADCKAALEASGDDLAAAEKWLREKGAIKAAKRADKETNEGLIEAYIHAGGKVGVILMLTCETDFVARNENFKALVKDIAMHIAASDPLYLRAEDVPAEDIEKEKEVLRGQLEQEGKPSDMIEKILEGKMAKWHEEVSLLNQKYVKNEDLTIQEVLNEAVASMGERIEIKRFTRFALQGNNTACGL